MKSLQTIQKTFRFFQILTKIAFVFSIVGAAICAVGVLCAAVWYNGGQVFSLFGEPVTIFSSGEGLNQALAVLLVRLRPGSCRVIGVTGDSLLSKGLLC